MSVIGDIGTAITLLGKARELAKQTANIELQEIIVDLSGKLVDLKAELVDYKEEKLRLEERIKSLEAAMAKAQAGPEVTLKDGKYYKADGDGPFCTRCYDAEGKLIRLNEMDSQNGRMMGIQWRCAQCKSHVKWYSA